MSGKSKPKHVRFREDQEQEFEDQEQADSQKQTFHQIQRSGHLAWRVTVLAVVMDTALVAGVWLWWLGRAGVEATHHRNYDAGLGWVAAISAAVVFGFSEVPIKIPGSQESGPTLFNAYGFIGNGALHLLVAFCLRKPRQAWRPHWTGVLAACDIAVVQALARSAIWLLGIAMGPPLWCAVGMATSFTWGTMVFGDSVQHMGLSVLGVATLVAGVGLVSGAGYLSRLHEEASTPEVACCNPEAEAAEAEAEDSAREPGTLRGPSDEAGLSQAQTKALPQASPQGATRIGRVLAEPGDPEQHSQSPRSSLAMVAAAEATPRRGQRLQALALGLLYALGAGLADGSLVACYQWMEQPSKSDSLSQLLCEYFGSFGLTILLVGLTTIASAYLAGLTTPQQAAHAPLAVKARLNSSSVIAGSISGCMWAGAHTCSVLASHFLGMALAFPVTQTCVAISGLVGMFAFGEIVGWRARGTFSAALMVVLSGAVMLSRFGHPAS